MITQEAAEKAVDWLVTNARTMAAARAQRLYMEQWIKTVKATLMQEMVGLSMAAAESSALSSPRYLEALQAYREAVEADEHNRFLVTAAEAKIEAWRSQEASRRAEGKAYT